MIGGSLINYLKPNYSRLVQASGSVSLMGSIINSDDISRLEHTESSETLTQTGDLIRTINRMKGSIAARFRK